MKRKHEAKKESCITKKQLHLLVSIWGLLAVLILYIGSYVTRMEEAAQVAAHPTSTIALDAGEATEFEVPVDGTELIETAIVSAAPVYDDYVQGLTIGGYFQKNVLNTYHESGINSWAFAANVSYQFENGNWLVIVLTTIASPSNASRQVAYYLDKDGNVIDEYFGAIKTGVVNNRFETVLGKGSSANSCIISGKEGSQVTYFYEASIVSEQIVMTKIGQAPTAVTGNLITDGYYDRTTTKLIMPEVVTGSALPTTGYCKVKRWQYDSGNLTEVQALYFPERSAGSIGTGVMQWTVQNIQQAANGRIVGHTSMNNTLATQSAINAQIEVFDDTTGYSIANYNLGEGQFAGIRIAKIPAAATANKVYYLVYSPNQTTKIIEVDVEPATPVFTIVKEFSANSNFILAQDGSNYAFFGYVGDTTGDFASFPLVDSSSVVSGTMDGHFNVLGAKSAGTYSSPLSFISVISLGTSASGSSRYGVYGLTNANLDVALPAGATSNTDNKHFFGAFEGVDDYSPIIKNNGHFTIDITDPDLSTAGVLDNWLISGEKAGTASSATSILTYDYTDITINGQTGSWLQSRINRNPYNLSADIDWNTLGFDKTKTGPQLITYFVTDSLLQPAATSRWANATTTQTVIDDDYALDAQNFAIPVTDIAAVITTEENFKSLAQTMAWDMERHEIDEDGAAGAFDSAKVTVDASQLAALQTATEAKPYPVDVTYDPYGDGSLLLVNRVWVFATTKNTTVDKSNGIVIYADDYTLPIQLAQSETKADVYTHANVKVYDYYDANHENTEPLSTLADKLNTTGLDVANLAVITSAANASIVQPDITYISSTGTTITSPDVTITANVLFHLRQVVYADSLSQLDQLVIPREGYLSLKNTSTKELSVVVTSGEESTNPVYQDYYAEIDTAGGNNKLKFIVVLPEYYEYMGYVVSDAAAVHQASVLSGTDSYTYDFSSGIYEQWLTVYIRPYLDVMKQPGGYSWDYKTNLLGTIQVP